MWALGMVMIQLILRGTHFETGSSETRLKAQLRNAFLFAPHSDFFRQLRSMWQSEPGLDLLLACMKWDEKKRISPESALQHSYFDGFRPTNLFSYPIKI